MKKLYRKGTVFPTPPLVSDQLAFLPVAIFTLTASLSQEDREVLAYLLSCPSGNFSTAKTTTTGAAAKGGADHPPSFNCFCFNCYRSYWARWDSSPNRQLIDEIIEAYEDGLHSKKEKSRRERRKQSNNNNKGCGGNSSGELIRKPEVVTTLNKDDSDAAASTAEQPSHSGDGGGGEEDGGERGSVRRFVSFLGEKIWSVWS